jgi:hypothetical protein
MAEKRNVDMTGSHRNLPLYWQRAGR